MLHNENRYVTASGSRYVTAGYSKTDYLRERERERERERDVFDDTKVCEMIWAD